MVEAPPEKLRRLSELREQVRRAHGVVSRHIDVYAALGFEPNCAVRWAARRRLCQDCDDTELAAQPVGPPRRCAHERVPAEQLPPFCGRCPQEQFLNLPDHDEDVLYGGSAAGSKSTSLMVHALRSCVRYPGLQAFWFRRSYPELNHSIVRTLGRYNYGRTLGARYNQGNHELHFDNGSILTFAHAKNVQEATALLSAEINALYIDERTTIPPEVIDHLYPRVRSGVADVPCLGVRSATNPGDVGHLQVLRQYIKPTERGAHTYTDDAGRTVRFIQARASDNPHVDPATYEKRLSGIADPALRAAMRDGSWDVFPDQFFGDFHYDRHVVPALELPASWMRYGGLDYGWSQPSVYLLAARDNDNRLWVYRELTMVQVPEPEQARRVLECEDVRPVMRSCDPSMTGKSGSAMPPMSQYAIAGCGLRKADNDRVGGWSRIHTFLAEAPACAYHREQGWDTCPMVHFVDTGCPKLIETLPTLPRDKNRPEDVLKCDTDHWADACLVAGTLIATRRGDVPIERVRVGDEVMTRVGWRRVRDACQTGHDRPVRTLMTSDGRTLTGTGNHPVYVEGRGFVALDAVRYFDTLVAWVASRSSSSTASSSAATRTLTGSPTLATSPLASGTSSAATSASTRKCGRPTTADRSLTVTTSTMSMKTSGTTLRAIWDSYRPRCTATDSTIRRVAPATPDMRSTSTPSGRSPLNGIAATRAASGTASMDARAGKTASIATSPASGAAKRSLPATLAVGLGSAPTSTGPTRARPAGSTTRTAPAEAAAAPSGSTATARPVTVPASVRGSFASGTADVYNLSVEDAEEYFANGILVHNCRYLIMSIGSTARLVLDADDQPPPIVPEQDQHEQRGPVAWQRGALTVGGEDAELDPAVVGGSASPYV